MPVFPPDQKIPNVKRKTLPASNQKTPRTKLSDPHFQTSEGDLGVKRIQSSNIPKMVKAPTRTGDALSNHVGKVGSVMKKRGMLV